MIEFHVLGNGEPVATLRSRMGAFSVQHRFTGQPQDDLEGGLYNYGARFYNPKWGRFVSPDEMVQSFDSQGLNPFTYVLNRPTSATDPTGNQGEGGDGGLGGVGGGMSGGAFGGGLGPMGGIGSGFSGCASLWSLATGGGGSDVALGDVQADFSDFHPLLGGEIVLVDMPGTSDGGAADRGQAVQDAIARNAQIRAIKKAVDELKEIRRKYTGKPVDAYGQVVIKADRRPSITELGREVETPIFTSVTPIVVSPGSAPPPAMVPGDTPSRVTYVLNVLVIRNGRPEEIR